MNKKLRPINADIVKSFSDGYLLKTDDGRRIGIKLIGYGEKKNITCWVDENKDIKEISYEESGKLRSVDLGNKDKHYTKTSFENKHLFTDDGREIATGLAELPPLQNGYVRLKHRCMSESVSSILSQGLVFNRQFTKTSTGGAMYGCVTAMATCYENSDEFWNSMEKDDFACFNNSRYADTQVIMDIPLEEFEILQNRVKTSGKVDKKYIVGVIPNYNGANPNLVMSKEAVEKAKKLSILPKKNVLPIGIQNTADR